jgi:alkylation response protein AidB-like acyl-CoA dehydrogenase
MNFDLTEEQQLLADTARDVLSRSYDTESRNKIVESELGWSRDVWRQLAEIGILGLGFEPEESGQIEIMVVMTEVGRRLAPEPVATAALIPGGVIA